MTKLEELARTHFELMRRDWAAWEEWDELHEQPKQHLIEAMRATLQNLKHGNFAMAGAATKVTTLARWTPHMLWDAVIDAILEEKPSGD